MINPKIELNELNMVIGCPLDHTQSPLLHNTVYSLLNYNAIMRTYTGSNLIVMMEVLKKLSVGLIAVTMPFKKEILTYLDNKSPEVEKLQAANTVICRDGQLFGFNTDVDGVAYAMRHVDLLNKTVLIIGAGGASSALAYYLKIHKANLLWLNRTPQHLLPLIEIFGGNIIDNQPIQQLPIDVIVNTTPLGMFPHINHSPLPDYQFTSTQTIFDMVYNPVDTLLLKKARIAGAACISGLDMFIGQGLKQIELWLNKSINTPQIMTLLKTTLQKSQRNFDKC